MHRGRRENAGSGTRRRWTEKEPERTSLGDLDVAGGQNLPHIDSGFWDGGTGGSVRGRGRRPVESYKLPVTTAVDGCGGLRNDSATVRIWLANLAGETIDAFSHTVGRKLTLFDDVFLAAGNGDSAYSYEIRSFCRHFEWC